MKAEADGGGGDEVVKDSYSNADAMQRKFNYGDSPHGVDGKQ